MFLSPFLVALVLPLVGATLPSQFDATCPQGCHCTRNKFTCEDLHSTDPNVLFPHASPVVFKDLDTLVITGNDFGDVRGENLFGRDQKHLKLSLVNLTNSGITAFDASTFEGLPAVEFLYLGQNNLTEVGHHPFQHLGKLQLLDLTNVFGRGVSAQVKADILRDLFDHNTDIELKHIVLNDNELEFLHPDTFCKVTGLNQLDLGNNKLKEFPISQDGHCFPVLQHLNLQANLMEVVPKHLYNGPVEINALDISMNPLVCNCESTEFVKYVQKENINFLNQDFTNCQAPLPMKSRSIFQMEPDDLCASSGGHHFLVFFLLIVLVAVFAYRYARKHNVRFSMPSRIPFLAGYSVLKSNDEGTAPQFV